MKTATFIEQSLSNQKISRTVKKRVPWQSVFDNLKVGDVFEAEFSEDGLTMDFKIIHIVKDNDPLQLGDLVTFYIINVKKQDS
jgi:hypothetical protein